MPAAIAIPLIGAAASGAASLGAAKIQSNAAKKAQQQQQTATNQALAVQQQANAPYLALGQQAAQRLQQMGPPPPYTQQFRPGQPNNGYQAPSPPMTLGGIGQQQQPDASPFGQMVTLQAPDGSTRQFPAQQAQQVLQQARAAGHELRMVG